MDQIFNIQIQSDLVIQTGLYGFQLTRNIPRLKDSSNLRPTLFCKGWIFAKKTSTIIINAAHLFLLHADKNCSIDCYNIKPVILKSVLDAQRTIFSRYNKINTTTCHDSFCLNTKFLLVISIPIVSD